MDFIGHAVALHRDDYYLDEPALDTVKRMQVIIFVLPKISSTLGLFLYIFMLQFEIYGAHLTCFLFYGSFMQSRLHVLVVDRLISTRFMALQSFPRSSTDIAFPLFCFIS